MSTNETIVSRNGREITYTRILNAPRELVWEVWTKGEHLKQWWGPDGFSLTNKDIDVKEGGHWLFTMHGWGQDFPSKILYTEVKPPERLVYRHASDDPNEEISFHVVVTFEEFENKTKLTMHSVFSSAEEFDRLNKEVNAIESGKQTMGKLSAYVENLALV